jgi:serine phosphatase RsbU (regulator of sigma subunit)
MFFLYTDGLTEAFNASEEEFGPERLKLLLQDLKIDDPEIVVKNVLVNVADFVGDRPYSDDITLLACNFLV